MRSVRWLVRDGYVYGDHVPDYIFLLMESQNDFGGESFFVECVQIPSRFCWLSTAQPLNLLVVISGEAVLRRLSAGPRAAEVMPLLTTLPFDQTESAENGGFFQGTQPRFLSDYDGQLQVAQVGFRVT